MKKRVFAILAVLISLVPIGLLTDAPAWGEWESGYFKEKLGYVPEGIEKFGNGIGLNYPLPDYTLPGAGEVVGYYFSAIVGAILIFLFYYFIYLIIKRKKV